MVMVPCPGLSCGSVKHAKSSISFCCCAAAMVFKAFFFFFLSLLGGGFWTYWLRVNSTGTGGFWKFDFLGREP